MCGSPAYSHRARPTPGPNWRRPSIRLAHWPSRRRRHLAREYGTQPGIHTRVGRLANSATSHPRHQPMASACGPLDAGVQSARINQRGCGPILSAGHTAFAPAATSRCCCVLIRYGSAPGPPARHVDYCPLGPPERRHCLARESYGIGRFTSGRGQVASCCLRFGTGAALWTTGPGGAGVSIRGFESILPGQPACRAHLVEGVAPAAGRHRDSGRGPWQQPSSLAASYAPEARS